MEAPIHDRFAEILTEKTSKLVVDGQMNENTDVGPLISEIAAQKVESAIQHAVESGAKLWIGGKRKQAFIEPTVVTDIFPEVALYRQETFGSVVRLAPFDKEADAIFTANDSPYGLQAAVSTNYISRALDVAHKLETGGVIVNWSSVVRVENLPFGGVKLSGHGREGLHDTLNDMTEQKTIIVHNALSASSSDD